MGAAGATGGVGVTRGFDENGDPYVDQRMPDGSIRRTQQNAITVIHPDGSTQRIPLLSTRSHAQAPTPPDLPADPTRGRAWMEQHSAALLAMIKSLARNDDSEMAKFAKGERATVGDDLFAQLKYRTDVAGFLAGQH